MSRFSKNIEDSDQSTIEQFIEDFGKKYSSFSDENLTREDIEQTFEYREALLMTDQVEKAAEVLTGLREKIFRFREIGGDPVSFIEFFSEWTLLAVAYTTENKKEFVCMPYYQSLLDAYETVPDASYSELVKTKLQLIFHYSFWKDAGGLVANLSEDEREMLETMQVEFPDEVETNANQANEKADFKLALELMKSLYRYYLSLKKPNDAITWLKAAIEVLPKIMDYKETELADMNLDLGKILFGYKKYTAALRYFETAKEIYANDGEDSEIKFYQAESWVEDCMQLTIDN